MTILKIIKSFANTNVSRIINKQKILRYESQESIEWAKGAHSCHMPKSEKYRHFEMKIILFGHIFIDYFTFTIILPRRIQIL